MKKVIVGVLFVSFMLLAVGFFTSAQTNSTELNNTLQNDSSVTEDDSTLINENDTTVEDSGDLESKFDEGISEWAYDYIYNFIKKMNISEDDVISVSLVDFDNLPESVNLGSIGDDSNLAIYEVAFNKDGEVKKVYVVTYSLDKVDSQDDIFPTSKRQFLNFGFSGKVVNSVFLKTSTEVETSLEKGYVMMRDGSITAISTNLKIFKEDKGDVEIIIYINGEPVGFGNLLSAESEGVKKDYDVISEDTVTFNAGDVVSVYLKTQVGVSLEDVTTLVEITTK